MRAKKSKSQDKAALGSAKEILEAGKTPATDESWSAPPDAATVREKINELVRASAIDMAKKVIEVTKSGRVTQAKYLFEMAGLYPAREESRARVGEESLAQVLLRRLNLPVEPVAADRGVAAERPTGEGATTS